MAKATTTKAYQQKPKRKGRAVKAKNKHKR